MIKSRGPTEAAWSRKSGNQEILVEDDLVIARSGNNDSGSFFFLGYSVLSIR